MFQKFPNEVLEFNETLGLILTLEIENNHHFEIWPYVGSHDGLHDVGCCNTSPSMYINTLQILLTVKCFSKVHIILYQT